MHVYYELADYFTFEVPGAKFMPTYKNKYWDGKIRLFNIQNNQIYVGLLDKIVQFCKDHEYTYDFQPSKFYGLPFEVNVCPSGFSGLFLNFCIVSTGTFFLFPILK